ncbi:MAG: ACP S-malonyltransferase [Eggerthellaceae bacterium]
MSVWMMPGQGAQKVGMGADLLRVPEVLKAFESAQAATGIDVVYLAQQGSEAEINDALNSQLLTAAISVGVADALRARGFAPDAVVGFSLGEISGLMVAGMLSHEEGFALLNERSRALASACKETAGAMVALLGATHEDAQGVCDVCAEGDTLVCANYNAPGQVVLSGDVAAIERAEAYWKEAGKRAARLRTAGAFHSPLMQSASDRMRTFASKLTFTANGLCPLICNTDAKPFVASEAADRLARQIVSPVLFEQSIAGLASKGESTFVEVGFGGVLTNLVKRIDRKATRIKIGSYEEWEQALETLVPHSNEA